MRSRRLAIATLVVLLVIVALAHGFGGRLEHWLLRLHGIH